MQTKSLRATVALSLPFGTFLIGSLTSGMLAAPAACQSQGKPAAPSAAALPDARGDNDDVDGLPSFLLKVPGGNTEVGLDVDAFLKAVAEATFPMRPEKAHEIAEEKFITAMRRTASVLGRKTVTVEPFLLGKWPVKNSEYLVYVDQQRALNLPMRAPYHWWRYGSKDDYEKKLDDIRKAFPKDPLGALRFWERHGEKLPYKLLDDDGKSIADMPVVYISWRDANRFAASLGMRLPLEFELMRAMRGDGKNTWPLGTPEKDVFDDELLKQLQIFSSNQWRNKPVGTVPAAVGPYGHVDMFGQVWQLVGDLGYLPIHGVEAFEDPWKKLQKNKIGRLMDSKPAWRVELAIAKGGSYLSYQEPVQLMIDARAPMQTTDVFESVGLRLAKSLKPGYDYLYSLQRVQFSRDRFGKDQDLDLTGQIGAERYTLADDGFPSAYEAVTFAPVNWLVDERVRLADLMDATQEKPMIIGGLATTAKFDNGVDAGLYAVLFRSQGIPRDLSDAVKRGHKEVLKERKAKEKNGDKDEKDKEDDKKDDKKDSWRTVIRRYGLTDDDIAEAAAADGDIGFVRIDGVQVPTDSDTFLLSKNSAVVGFLAGTNKKPAVDQPFPATLTIEAGKKGDKDKAVAKFRFGAPLQAGKDKKVIAFDLHVVLDLAAPTAEIPWRLPTNETEKK